MFILIDSIIQDFFFPVGVRNIIKHTINGIFSCSCSMICCSKFSKFQKGYRLKISKIRLCKKVLKYWIFSNIWSAFSTYIFAIIDYKYQGTLATFYMFLPKFLCGGLTPKISWRKEDAIPFPSLSGNFPCQEFKSYFHSRNDWLIPFKWQVSTGNNYLWKEEVFNFRMSEHHL